MLDGSWGLIRSRVFGLMLLALGLWDLALGLAVWGLVPWAQKLVTWERLL